MRVFFWVLVSTLLFLGCDDDGGTDGTGGQAMTGGAMGGAPQMGGMPMPGGQSQMGGMAMTGGQAAMGGMPSVGGAPGMGGMPMAGGAPGMGGTPAAGGMPMAGGAPGMGGAPAGETDCEMLCREVFSCGFEDSGTEEECVTFCTENPNLFSARIYECAREHLAEARCDEPNFDRCAQGPIIRFFEEAATAVCSRIFECCPSGQQGAFFGTVEDCVGLIAGFGGGLFDGAVNMGYIRFDEAAVAQCLTEADASLAAIDCAEFPNDVGLVLNGVVGCDGVLVPLKAEGEDCGLGEAGGQGFLPLDEACTEGLLCRAEGDEMPTCRPGIPTGGACNPDEGGCLGDDECVDAVCVTLVAQGEACANSGLCQSGNCVEGLCGAPEPIACNEE